MPFAASVNSHFQSHYLVEFEVMKMGLLPLEFTECLQDSPYFRDSLHSHEKELERTSNNIKELIKQVKSLLNAAKGKFKGPNFGTIFCLETSPSGDAGCSKLSFTLQAFYVRTSMTCITTPI